MAIERIDEASCSGCGNCVNYCPADVIRLDKEKKKAVMVYPKDCVSCGYCAPACPRGAVAFSWPPADAGPPRYSW